METVVDQVGHSVVGSANLLVSLSGIRPATLDACMALTAQLDARAVPVSLLLVPRRPGGACVLDWIRERASRGDAILVHGYDHNLDPIGCWGSHTVARLGRRAEFATLPAHEAGLRLQAAAILLRQLDLPADVFIPPRWLASAGTLRALEQHRYRVCADATAIHDLRLARAYRARVLEFAVLEAGLFGLTPGERTELWWCRAITLGAARTARRGGLVRIAVDATDLARSARRTALLAAVDAALHHGAAPSTYSAITEQLARAA
jgi:uncharacterized protein